MNKLTEINTHGIATWAVYAVLFDDGRIKIGVSKNPRQRMKYYSQEVRRNFGKCFTWFSCKPFACKKYALAAETALCRWLADLSIPGHREWFYGATTKEFILVVGHIERFRLELAIESDEEKRDIPYHGMSGSYNNMEVV